MREVLLFLVVSVSLWTHVRANADERSAGPGWNPFSAGPVTTWTAPLCGQGEFVLQPFVFYNNTRGIFDSKGHYRTLPGGDQKDQFQEQLFLQYGVMDCLEIDAQTVYQQNNIKQGHQEAHANGLGDSFLWLRYRISREKGWVPYLVAFWQVKVPTGKYQHADPDKLGVDLMGATSGGGSWDYGLGINFSKKLKPFYVHVDAIYSLPQEVRVNGAKSKYGHYLNYDFAVEYFLPKGLNLMIELNGFSQGNKEENGDRTPDSEVRSLALAPGIGWSCEEIKTLLAYQRTLAGTNTDADDSVVFTFVYEF